MQLSSSVNLPVNPCLHEQITAFSFNTKHNPPFLQIFTSIGQITIGVPVVCTDMAVVVVEAVVKEISHKVPNLLLTLNIKPF